MRLRSPQFVFLLLLVCSVQHREKCALQLMGGAHAGLASNDQQYYDIDPAIALPNRSASLSADQPAPETRLDPAALRAHSTPWAMRRPALASAAVSSFTGFLRA